ncbi:TPA: hypothetical protein DDW35_00920 [Candidatus Sumerlaeota bacterium]|jgi:inhibitor of cysteine peptidase|nr:hypothetical protein [Candidatus Sumerlaeota bacterium]
MLINLRMLKPCFLIALVCAALLAFSAPCLATAGEKKEAKSQVKQLTESDADTTVTIVVGTSFDITLKGNPTTGYGWQVEKIDSSAVTQKGESEYASEPNSAGRVGAGGTMTFHFEVKESAKTVVQLVYMRPWEKGKVKPIKTFTVTIDSRK